MLPNRSDAFILHEPYFGLGDPSFLHMPARLQIISLLKNSREWRARLIRRQQLINYFLSFKTVLPASGCQPMASKIQTTTIEECSTPLPYPSMINPSPFTTTTTDVVPISYLTSALHVDLDSVEASLDIPLAVMAEAAQDDVDVARRMEELDALKAFYGDDVRVRDEENPGLGPWTLKIAPGIDLELQLPPSYPSKEAPIPRIQAPSYVVDDGRRKELEAEMIEMYQEDTEVAIMWAEHVRASLGDEDLLVPPETDDEKGAGDHDEKTAPSDDNLEGARVFHPSTSKFGQPTRQFDETVILDESNRRSIHRGQPYHPPKSGASETMIAHVASVESMNHVNWVLAELLLNDKKVAKASHNMIAYRFWDKDRQCMVSDNDDDGEKGAGAKLAALLEMANVQNVIVVVSRWYGGVHLGSSRFKYFASTARDALQEAGFIKK